MLLAELDKLYKINIDIKLMKSHIVVYTSDLHGNETQYEKLIEYSNKINADSIIIGGDIAPKDLVDADFIPSQKNFLEYRLPSLLSKKKQDTKVFLILGNDDCMVNEPITHNNGIYHSIHKKRMQLTEDFDIVGYSYVPITPFGIKDWEKFDFREVPEHLVSEYEQRKKTNYLLDGWKSTAAGWKEFTFKQGDESDSIQEDLSSNLFKDNPEKTIYVMHAPPDRTNLDIMIDGKHAGSMAIKSFIEKCQPYLTLHGHIHETVLMSRDFRQPIGKTISLSSGNHNVGRNLAVIVFDVYNLISAKRYVL